MTTKEKYLDSDFISLFRYYDNLEKYGVNVDLFVEEGGYYKEYGVRPCVYFRNGYDDKISEKLPLIICNEPYIPFRCKLNIWPTDFYRLCGIVSANQYNLLKMCNRKLDLHYFCKKKLKECKDNLLNEMSIIKKNVSGLPMNVWLDGGETLKNTGHWMRLKFKDKNSGDDSMTWPSITIPDLNLVGKTDRPVRDLDLIRSFYIQNRDIINRYLRGEIKEPQLLNNIVMIDKHGKPQKKETEYYIYKRTRFGIHVVFDKNGKFNYYDENKGELLSNIWFDEAYPFEYNFSVTSKAPIGSVLYNGIPCFISINGKLFDA